MQAVQVYPQPHPGVPHAHTIANGVGRNGGITAIDGPTFLSTTGWDWLPSVADRDTGQWQKVWLSTSGPVLIENPFVTTDLPLPRMDMADVTVKTTVENTSDKQQKGQLEGSFGDVKFSRKLTLAPHSTQIVAFDPKTTVALQVANPKLWWPNGYGPQNLYTLHLHFVRHGKDSDEK